MGDIPEKEFKRMILEMYETYACRRRCLWTGQETSNGCFGGHRGLRIGGQQDGPYGTGQKSCRDKTGRSQVAYVQVQKENGRGKDVHVHTTSVDGPGDLDVPLG